MSSAVAELENYLQSMLALKPPGVSGSKIGSITALCTANVQNESVLIQKIFTHFKKAPGTHKLGRPLERLGRLPGLTPPDGTFAAGVHRVSELLPVLMDNIINNAPQDQKEKIKKLIDIWERGYTFPAPLLASFREKLNAPPQNVESTTPEGSPAPGLNSMAPTQPPATNGAAPDTSSILKALADMAKQNTAAPAAAPVTAPANPLAALNPSIPQVSSADSTLSPSTANPYATTAGVANPYAALAGFAQNPALGQPQSQSQTPNPMAPAPNPMAAMLPQAAAPPMGDGNAFTQQLQLLQMLAAQGVPQDQPAPWIQCYARSNSRWLECSDGQGRDDRERDYNRSPGGYRRRSRSPGWDRRRTASPPRRRDSPVYGDYHGDSPGRRGDPRDARGRRGNEYRQRSPPGRRRRSPSPKGKDPNLPPPGPKLIEWDYSIGQGNIKVLSRTLFVGGVTSTEAHLRGLFNKFGIVQTCIVNVDKRHAFIKMITRQDAIAARDGMESFRSGRCNCTGVSVIPIERLTEADRKWMLTAEYGGTGGRPIESGMVVEEPDIEIGAGVSSKAISRRIPTDAGERDGFGGSGMPPQNDRPDFGNLNNPAVPPAVPAYGFNFPGMPMLPPGFMMGGTQAGSMPSSQPPPTGQGN
ncbi:hypothetical protein N7470_003023 [Penicillium chermesinum]|nr:hypothetical protein N7470_003023 [Penicillium chermesinum]